MDEIFDIKLPQAGDRHITTSKDHFEVNLFTGAAEYTYPLELSPARDLVPQLALSYHSSGGNSIFGWGFDIFIDKITRSTSKGIPSYDDKDIFLLQSQGELVFDEEGDSGKIYQPRLQKKFSVIKHIINNTQDYWIVHETNGINHIYGKSEITQIQHSKDKKKIFTWLLQESYDVKGNKIIYDYYKDKDSNNRHIKSIKYGNYKNGVNEEFAFHVVFDYGEYGFNEEQKPTDQDLFKPKNAYKQRPDIFISYKPGFLLQTNRRCKNILLIHEFKAINGFESINNGIPFLVKRWEFSYKNNESQNNLSLLENFQEHGYKKVDSNYLLASIPKITFDYEKFYPVKEFKDSRLKNSEADAANLPGNLLPFRFVDLYREGLPGILYSDETSTLYWRNRGEGKFSQAEELPFPIDRNLNSRRHQLINLPETDQLAFVVADETYGGFYENKDEKNWDNFVPFDKYPTDFINPSAELVDLNGSGCEDLVVLNEYQKIYYPSSGKKGFEEARPLTLPKDFPLASTAINPDEYVSFAKILGDGLSHRVRITANTVEYWPNLGHGEFGKKVEINDVPKFDENFDSTRLFFFDTNGTGTDDIVYIEPEKVKIYLNQHGKSFSKPIQIKLPEIYTNLDQIRVVDLFGKGTACLVFTKVDNNYQHYYCDLAPQQRPYVLKKIENGFGHTTEINYTSSVQCYVDDKKKERKMPYKCPFPVMVVSTVISTEGITERKLTEKYEFHDGYYNPTEGEFVGFGFVEHWDSEKSESVSIKYTKRWSHCGISVEGKLSNFYLQQYNQNDSKAFHLPDSIKENISESLNQQAIYSLRRSVLREEVYENDAEGKLYSTIEYNYEIKYIKANSSKGIFTVLPRETITHLYEGNFNDPKITHEFNLEWDNYNHLLKFCVVNYPRRKKDINTPQNYEQACLKVYDEQNKALAIGHWNNAKDRLIIKNQNQEKFYFDGLPIESKILEIIIDDNPDKLCTFDNVLKNYDDQKKITLVRAQKYYYWDKEFKDGIELKEDTEIYVPLIHHTEAYVESEANIRLIYSNKNYKLDKWKNAGYLLKEDHFWQPSLVQHYDRENFYLINKITSLDGISKENPLWQQTDIIYDAYKLLPVSIKRHLYNDLYNADIIKIKEVETKFAHDYYVMAPNKIIDPNENTSEVLYDPLGVVVASSHYGMCENKETGYEVLNESLLNSVGIRKPLSQVLNNIESSINGASSVFYYNFLEEKQPSVSFLVISDQFKKSLPSLSLTEVPKEKIQIWISYRDSLGYTIQNKALTDNENDKKWWVSGKAKYNDKNLIIEEYFPSFSKEEKYEPEIIQSLNMKYVYDVLERVIKTENAKKAKTKTKYRAWFEQHFDENDTDENSEFNDTPDIKIFNGLGHKFLDIQVLKSEKDEILTTRSELDIQGRVLKMQDPRFYKPENNTNADENIWNIEFDYDKLGNLLKEKSIDSGEKTNLYNIYGKIVHEWNNQDFHFEFEYDNWQRLTKRWVEGGEENLKKHCFHKVEYGQFENDFINKNLGGQISKIYDQTGIEHREIYDIQGNCIQNKKEFYFRRSNDEKELLSLIEWDKKLDNPKYTIEPFTEKKRFNASNFLIEKMLPDKSIFINTYTRLNQFNTLKLKPKNDKNFKEIIKLTSYVSDGQREKMQYGNGVFTECQYEKETQNLLQTETFSENKQKKLQHVCYIYDPVGNITDIGDQSYQLLFNNGKNNILQHKYDSLYRLKESIGNIFASDSPQSSSTVKMLNALKEEEPKPFKENYEYDKGNNLTKKTNYQDNKPKKDWSKVYHINEKSNRLEKINEKVQYDKAGNQLNLEDGTELRWNYLNQLIYAEKKEDNKTIKEFYEYDASGWRSRKLTQIWVKEGSEEKLKEESERVYLGQYEFKRDLKSEKKEKFETLHCYAGKNRVAMYHHGGAEQEQSKLLYQLINHLNSITLEIDEQGNPFSYEEYLPYGETVLIAFNDNKDADKKTYHYSGKEKDEATGFYYYGFRYYSFEEGRWLSPDPAGLIDGLNVYCFVQNNPINFFDENGFLGKRKSERIQDRNNRDAKKIKPSKTIPGLYVRGDEVRMVIDPDQSKLLKHKSQVVKNGENIVNVTTDAAIKNLIKERLNISAKNKKEMAGLPNDVKELFKNTPYSPRFFSAIPENISNDRIRPKYVLASIHNMDGTSARTTPADPHGGINSRRDDKGHLVPQKGTTASHSVDGPNNIIPENWVINQKYKTTFEETAKDLAKKHKVRTLHVPDYTSTKGGIHNDRQRPKRVTHYLEVDGTVVDALTLKNSKHILETRPTHS